MKITIKENKKYIKYYSQKIKKKFFTFKPREHDKKLVNIFKKNLKNKDCILDLGCGNGSSTNFYQKKFPRCFFYGVDYDKKILPKGKNSFPKFFAKNIISKKIINKNFDYLYTKAVLQTLPEDAIDVFFKNCFKLLKEKGKLIIFDCFFDDSEFDVFRFQYQRNKKSNDNIKDFSFFYLSKKALKEKLYKNGFKKVRFIDFSLNKKIKMKNSHSKLIKIGNKRFAGLLGPILQPWVFVVVEKGNKFSKDKL